MLVIKILSRGRDHEGQSHGSARRLVLPAWAICISMGLLAGPAGLAAADKLTFAPLGENRGLVAALPAALLFDRRGFLWVGSREGLYRYDGYRATKFVPDLDDPFAITDLDIRALYEDRAGTIWVATNTGGLNRLDPQTGEFTHYRHDSADPGTISHDSVYGMAEDDEGHLWAGSQIGLNRLDRESDQFTRYVNAPDDPDSLSNDYVFDVFRDSQGVLWIATLGGGLNRYNAASDTFSRFDLAALTGASADCNDVFELVEDRGGDLWIGTRCGLMRFDRSRADIELLDLSEPGSPQPVVTSIAVDAAGGLWLGTLIRGVISVDTRSGDWRAYTDYSDLEKGGLAAQPQLSLAILDDALFVGTWGAGVWVARLSEVDFLLLGTDTQKSGLRNNTVMAILAGTEPGKPWVGSFGGGAQAGDIHARTFATPADAADESATDGVLAMARAEDGRIFSGTNRGLRELDSAGSVIRSYLHRVDREGGIGEGYVTSLYFGSDGSLWIGVGGSGLYRLERGRQTFSSNRHEPDRADSLSGNYITAIVGDGDDGLWVGTRSNGLNRCRISTWSCQRIGASAEGREGLGHFHVTALHTDGRGRLWVATDGGGLHEVLLDNSGEFAGFRRWTEDEGLISDSVMAIEEDDDGSLWLSTRHGLARLDPDQGRVANFVEQSGLPTRHFNTNASDSDERFIYFGGVDGLLVIPRGLPFEIRQSAPTRITEIVRIGREDRRAATGWVPAVFETDYRDMLAIEFAALDYAEVPHDYEFRLDDHGDWTPLAQRTEVAFLDLAPGRYHFTVRGRDVFGLWNASPPLRIDVVPPFWMTGWFRLLVVVALVFTALGLHWLRTRRLRTRSLEMQRLGELREQALEQALGDRSELAGLTPRQKEVLQLIAEGNSTREIAERLGVSVKTVETHRANLMERLGIRDVPGLVRLAIRARLISPHD